jgi:hypothetical protein
VIKWWIASGREMDLGEPGNEKNDAIGAATRNERNEEVSLLERFRDHPEETRHEVRVELGWLEEMAAEFFALVVFLCDSLLEIRGESMTGAARFFRIAQKLPIELQMVLSYRMVGSMGGNIRGEQRELAFRELAKKLLV